MWVKKILRHGNSLAVVVPIELRRSLQINRGDFVIIALGNDNTFHIKKIPREKAAELLDKDIQR